MYELFELPEKAIALSKWVTVTPKGELLSTGHGIIVDVVPMELGMQEMLHSEDPNLYLVMTDFGNVIRLTIEELESAYIPRLIEKDPKARFELQQELLREAYEQYFMEL